MPADRPMIMTNVNCSRGHSIKIENFQCCKGSFTVSKRVRVEGDINYCAQVSDNNVACRTTLQTRQMVPWIVVLYMDVMMSKVMYKLHFFPVTCLNIQQ